MANNRRISWDEIALQQFIAAIQYIANDSIQNAEKVRIEVVEKIEQLLIHPEMYPPDKFKVDNCGNYRAFELHRLRIAYHVLTHEIIILRVRHTYREPLTY